MEGGYFLKIYQDKNGQSPFIKWLEKSIKNIETRANIKNRLRRIELGNIGDCKKIGNGISEIRLHFNGGYRVYFAKIDNCILLLLCGGNKSSQKEDIKKAIKYWHDYQKKS